MRTNQLIDQLIETLSPNITLALYTKSFKGFNREELNNPMDRLYLSFLPHSINTSYFEDETSGTCKKIEVTIKMTVYAPVSRKSQQIHTIAEIATDLISDAYIGELQDYSIGNLSYNESVNALTLPVLFRFVYNECPLGGDEEEELVSERIPESFFCKCHVNNTDVHLSEADRSYINEPYVIGTYTGDGNSSGLDINLGFRPKAVIIYRNSYHISSYSTSDGVSNCYMGMAIGSSYTRGPLILDNGFRVKTVVTSSATTHLNDEGGAYTYIAFK